jgi:hypothetical protein
MMSGQGVTRPGPGSVVVASTTVPPEAETHGGVGPPLPRSLQISEMLCAMILGAVWRETPADAGGSGSRGG